MQQHQAAMHRLSHIAAIHHQFDEHALTPGAGVIHFVVELESQLCLAWENDDTGEMIVSPIVCWELENVLEALSAPWPVLSVPADSAKAIRFRDLQDDEVKAAYRRMERKAIAAPSSPVRKAQ
jgi:hypothetical protein